MIDSLKRDAAGFRLRGLEMTRIETFTDAAFAFALTLLVIASNPLTDFDSLYEAMRAIPAFVMSATLLMMFWWGHHEWSRRYGLDDRRAFLLSCLLVFTVLVYVYPLRFMSGMFITYVSYLAGIDWWHVATAPEPRDITWMFAIYGVGWTAMATAIMLLNLHAWQNRDVLQLDALERHETRGTIVVWLILASVGVLSFALALLLPPTFWGIPGWAYALLSVIMPIVGSHHNRTRPVSAER